MQNLIHISHLHQKKKRVQFPTKAIIRFAVLMAAVAALVIVTHDQRVKSEVSQVLELKSA